MKGKVLIAAHVHEVLITGLEDAGYECIIHENIKQEEGHTLLADCTGLIISTRLQVDKQILDAAPNLRWIGRMGSGMEIIDTEYAAQKGIACYSSPEGNCNAVAEHALGMLLALNKNIVKGHNEVRQGMWLRDENRGVELEGKTIAIIGFGHTGRAFAKKLQGFDMRILAYDVCKLRDLPAYVECTDDISRIYNEAQIISFHVPLKEDTVNYFNNGFLEQMRHPFVLLNTSRGKVCSIASMLKGLKTGQITGICLDVLEVEPLKSMNEDLRNMVGDLLNNPNVIVTPHIAGYSFEAVYKMSAALLGKIVTQG